MRLVQLTVPTGKRETILEELDDRGIDYVLTDEESNRGYTAVVYFPLPDPAVEPVLDELQDVGVDEDAYTVVVDAETVVSRRFEALREEYENGDVETDRISRQELQSEADSLTPTFAVYVIMTVISAVVATAGLFLDSPAVVVGSMVIAPLIGPALGLSVGSVIDDEELFKESLVYQILGIVLAIGAAAIFALLVRVTNIVPPGLNISTVGEISERLAPDLLSLAIALGAGVAGIISIATGTAVALVGVMIAAALIPPAAAAGIAIAWGEPAAAIGATVLVLVNVLSVNLAGLLTLWWAGYRPENLFSLGETEQRVRRRVLGLAVIVLVFAVFLGAITYSSYTVSTFEENANDEAQRVLSEEEFAEYQLLEFDVVMDESYPFIGPQRVVVTVGGPPGEAPPELADRLHERINQHTDEEVDVQVRYVGLLER
ncbi:TIGR00341 family protein [Haloterrigena sp. SYSU A558-1]|uniref:TIGR00341 family protein n=1 Tax=Haloterrigena gelatinilytica TaxID=2741724 RepID=A0A8J8KGC3_9EURY|nr:TIGR00341 family protein [Haloterrigena gelatinilytica]NUB89864.1 TIGR00341 family protein [Haloterrigena gelatinilytica]NUC74310.1 TIGR00341 family protein [Haloterrigena gelatinilytica]